MSGMAIAHGMAIAVIRKSGLRPSAVIVRFRFATTLLKGSRMPSFHSEAVYKSKAMMSLRSAVYRVGMRFANTRMVREARRFGQDLP